MNLSGSTTAFRLDDLVCLIRAEELEGTLTLRRDERRAELLFQGGLVMFPMRAPSLTRRRRQRASSARSRARDVHHANKDLSRALGWRDAEFTFVPGHTPKGFSARRSVVIKPSKLLAAIRKLRDPGRRPSSSRVGMLGALSSGGLRLLLDHLSWGRYSGVLILGAGDNPLTLCFADGVPYVRRPQTGAPRRTKRGDEVELPLPLDCVEAATFAWSRGKVGNLIRSPETFVRVAPTAPEPLLVRSAG